jgi:MFS family permease
MGLGSVTGALTMGARGRVGSRLIIASALGFGVLATLAAAAPTLPLEMLVLVPLGAATVTFAAGVNSALQLAVDPAMRGRVMALYSMVFLGSAPIGAPIAGWLAEAIDPRASLLMAAASALVAAVGARIAYDRVAAARLSPPEAGAADAPPACDPARVRAFAPGEPAEARRSAPHRSERRRVPLSR